MFAMACVEKVHELFKRLIAKGTPRTVAQVPKQEVLPPLTSPEAEPDKLEKEIDA